MLFLSRGVTLVLFNVKCFFLATGITAVSAYHRNKQNGKLVHVETSFNSHQSHAKGSAIQSGCRSFAGICSHEASGKHRHLAAQPCKGQNMVVPPRSRHVGTANSIEIICDESRLEILLFQIIYNVFTFCIVLKQYWHRSAYSTID